jgi:pimeloyl-ACP methyl ester carboxylesterase
MPRAEAVVVADSGHAANWENPEAFNRAVLRFVRKHSRR